ncbi:MAG: phasin family protein, partial [Xanthomonadales bacterium]|nr:phasin family protein [Xanthomonadales bacterium]
MAKFKKTAKGKSSASTAQAKLEDVSRSIVDSAQQIWQAGMGAFNRAQAEGSKLFEALVREGATLEQKTRKMATGKVDVVREAVETRVDQARERATDTWDRLEKVFEDRVQRALNKLGVPGREEIQSLTDRIEVLTDAVRKLNGEKPAAKKATKKEASKPATK